MTQDQQSFIESIISHLAPVVSNPVMVLDDDKNLMGLMEEPDAEAYADQWEREELNEIKENMQQM